MRAPVLALALLLAASALALPTRGEDFAAVGKVNKLIDVRETPQLAPGDSGQFFFDLNSTYTDPIRDVALTLEIYAYETIDTSVPVDSTWTYAYPRFQESGGRSVAWSWSEIPAGHVEPLNATVLTAADSDAMPHGSVFSQATYLLRTKLTFTANVSGTGRTVLLASRGYFTEAQWEGATNKSHVEPCTPPWCRGNVNLTYLSVDGTVADGVLPDSSFGVKEPIPEWPFYALMGTTGFFLVLAFLFWVEENPGAYPRIEAWWARTRGRIVRTFRRPRRTKESKP